MGAESYGLLREATMLTNKLELPSPRAVRMISETALSRMREGYQMTTTDKKPDKNGHIWEHISTGDEAWDFGISICTRCKKDYRYSEQRCKHDATGGKEA